MTAIHSILASTPSVEASLTVTLTPPSISVTGSSQGLVTGFVTASAVGGSGTYIYVWENISGEGIPLDPFVASSRFLHTFEGEDTGTVNGTYRCTVVEQGNPSLSGFKNILVTFTRNP